MYLGLTGARLRGRDVVTAGVATHFVPSEGLPELEDILREFARREGPLDASTVSAAISTLDMKVSRQNGTSDRRNQDR